jgi:hypothetical protein
MVWSLLTWLTYIFERRMVFAGYLASHVSDEAVKKAIVTARVEGS